MEIAKADPGVVGLSVMGENLARNAARKGFGVALFNRHAARTETLVREHGAEGRFVPTNSLPEFVAALSNPRVTIVMVKAGKPVDDMIDELLPLLEPEDILIDAGNSLFSDSARRAEVCHARGVLFVGMGVSGGEQGALKGPSMMPGCEPAAYARIEPFLTRMAAQAGGRACCTLVGPGGAGHYVKMVHNGIEYADMWLIAEACDMLKTVHGLSAEAIGEIFSQWNVTELESYLIEIAGIVLGKRDATGRAQVDAIVDEAEQKGTGRWTAQSALDLGVPLTAITEAVCARALSAKRGVRATAEALFPREPAPAREPTPDAIESLRKALYAAKIVSYAQGFEQMRAASSEHGWRLDLGEIAAIWRGGCIIRARMLDRIMKAYAAEPRLENLLLAAEFRDAVSASEPEWRRVVANAVDPGVATPAFSSTLAYFDGLRRARGPANLLQGLRDFFGADTYRRLTSPASSTLAGGRAAIRFPQAEQGSGRRPSGRVGVEVDRIERRLGGDVEAVAVATAKTKVRHQLGNADPADQRSVGRIGAHRIRARRPQVAMPVDAEPVEETVVADRKDLVVAQRLSVRRDPVDVDRAGRVRHVRLAGVGDVEKRLVRREREAVGSNAIARDGLEFARRGVQPEDQGLLDLAPGEHALVKAIDAVGRIGEPDRAVGLHDDIVGRVQPFAVELRRESAPHSVVVETRNAPPEMLAGHHAPLVIKCVPVLIAAGRLEHTDRRIILDKPQHAIVRNVGPQHLPGGRNVHRPFRPSAPGPELL